MSRLRIAAVSLALAALGLPSVAKADFGIVPGSVGAVAENRNGTIASQAGAHPYTYTVSLKFKTGEDGRVEGGEPRDIIVDLPQGMVGNPLAVPRCPRQDFEGGSPQCSPSTQVGILRANIRGLGEIIGPLFNMVPPPGVAARIGLSAVSFNALQDASVRGEEGYGVRVGVFDIPLEVTSVSETIWGVPADPDSGCCAVSSRSSRR